MNPAARRSDLGVLLHEINEDANGIWLKVNVSIQREDEGICGLEESYKR